VQRPRDLDVLGVIAVGGALGSLARYGLERAVPHDDPAAFAWATFLTNVSGCLLIGVLMWLVLEVWGPRRYARPFLGIGVLGGFTTFSTYAVEAQGMARADAWATAAAYVVASVVLGLLAVRAGYWLARLATARRS
jgi:fluoride exporter